MICEGESFSFSRNSDGARVFHIGSTLDRKHVHVRQKCKPRYQRVGVFCCKFANAVCNAVLF